MEVTDQKLYTEDEVLDMVHAEIASRPQIKLPPMHTFTPGLYSRDLFMPAGMEIISKCHKTRHQWVVLFGIVDVYLKGTGWQRIIGPARGITEPGTRRVLRTITDTLWVTFHATDHMPEDDSEEAIEKAADMVDADIIEIRENPFLEAKQKGELQ